MELEQVWALMLAAEESGELEFAAELREMAWQLV